MAENQIRENREGKCKSFIISSTDEFNSEVELLRKNHKFISMLDSFKGENEAFPIDLVEKNLR
jgi:hypothetical protein